MPSTWQNQAPSLQDRHSPLRTSHSSRTGSKQLQHDTQCQSDSGIGRSRQVARHGHKKGHLEPGCWFLVPCLTRALSASCSRYLPCQGDQRVKSRHRGGCFINSATIFFEQKRQLFVSADANQKQSHLPCFDCPCVCAQVLRQLLRPFPGFF